MIKKKYQNKTSNQVIKQYTKDETIKILKETYDKFYSGQSCNIGYWEFETLFDMITEYDKSFLLTNDNQITIKKSKNVITSNGKIIIDLDKCPRCYGNIKKIDKYVYCNNSTCTYWYDILFKRFQTFLSDNDKKLVKQFQSTDFKQLSVIFDSDCLTRIFSNIDNISKIYDIDYFPKIQDNKSLTPLKYLEFLRNILIELSINIDYFDLVSRHLRSYMDYDCKRLFETISC